MNIVEFTNTLKHPNDISAVQTLQIENILEEFPYFQAAHFLYLHGLKKQDSFKYNNTLKKTAAYTADRDVLFDSISSFNFDFSSNFDNVSTTDLSETVATLDSENSQNLENQPHKLIENITPEETLSLGKPLKFDVSEPHSFNEWLQITSIKPIDRSLDEELFNKKIKDQRNISTSNFELIDKFIAANPKIKPSKTFIHNDISPDNIIEDENLMTETLARVYLEQKKYDKAISAFTILSLKYPEKSSFFANQIETIKKLE